MLIFVERWIPIFDTFNNKGLAAMAFSKGIQKIVKIDAKWPNSWSFIVDSYNFDNVVKSLTGL